MIQESEEGTAIILVEVEVEGAPEIKVIRLDNSECTFLSSIEPDQHPIRVKTMGTIHGLSIDRFLEMVFSKWSKESSTFLKALHQKRATTQ